MDSLIKGYTYDSKQPAKNGLACYVVGYGGKIKSYSSAIKQLQVAGYDVRIYEYSKTVFTSGNPKVLLKIIDAITTEIDAMSEKYKEVVCMGISLGSFIAFNVQKRIKKAHVGVYADAGISVAHAIYTARVFRGVAKTFSDNGYTEHSLSREWHLVDIMPLDPYKLSANKTLTIFNGTLDRVVKIKDARTNMEIWKSEGTNVELIVKPLHGHLTIGVWFIKNTKKVLRIAQDFHYRTPSPNL